MDLISQIQAYEKTLCDLYASTLREVMESPAIKEKNYNPNNYPNLVKEESNTDNTEMDIPGIEIEKS